MIRSMPSSRARRRRFGAADAAVDRDDERAPSACSRSIVGRLQAVAVAQPIGDEVHDVAAEQLERAPQDHRRGDAVDVVVAVDDDPLAARDRRRAAGRRPARMSASQKRIVQLLERRRQEARAPLGVVESALAQQPRDRPAARRARAVSAARVGVARPRRPQRRRRSSGSAVSVARERRARRRTPAPSRAHRAELLVARVEPRLRDDIADLGERLRAAPRRPAPRPASRIVVRAADRLRHDLVDDAAARAGRAR